MTGKSEADLRAALAADGFSVERVAQWYGCRGILARSRVDPERRALYLEGDPHTQGYLTGLLAAGDVARMSGEFVDNIVGAFVSGGPAHPLRSRALKRRLLDLLRDRCIRISYRHPDDIPAGLREEMKGIAEGCRAADPGTSVSFRELFLLNLGVDFLLSYAYTGAHRFDWVPDLRRLARLSRGPFLGRLRLALSARRPAPRHLRIPVACNAFSLPPSLTREGRHYLGRDFMFPTAGVFQDTCCLFVRVPAIGVPTASVSAPGMVGCVTVLSAAGIGAGMHMVPGQWCDFHRPGLNSLLLLRAVAEEARTLDEAVAAVVAAPRGVSWLYLLAGEGRAVVVEAAARAPPACGVEHVPEPYRSLLRRLDLPAGVAGAAVRAPGYRRGPELAALNRELFEAAGVSYRPEADTPGGRFHLASRSPWKERALPGPFFFPPTRIREADLLVAGNQFLMPEMRLASMGAWVSLLAGAQEDDFQWRSDELCSRLQAAVAAARGRGDGVTLEEAKRLVDFLSPSGDWPEYHAANARTPRGRRIEGALCLCDLTSRVLHACWGVYDGAWARISLPGYLP